MLPLYATGKGYRLGAQTSNHHPHVACQARMEARELPVPSAQGASATHGLTPPQGRGSAPPPNREVESRRGWFAGNQPRTPNVRSTVGATELRKSQLTRTQVASLHRTESASLDQVQTGAHYLAENGRARNSSSPGVVIRRRPRKAGGLIGGHPSVFLAVPRSAAELPLRAPGSRPCRLIALIDLRSVEPARGNQSSAIHTSSASAPMIGRTRRASERPKALTAVVGERP